MKVLILAPQPFYQPRGTPIAVRMLAETLARLGHGVDLLAFHEGEDVDMGPVCLHRSPRIPGISNIRPGFSVKKVLCDAVMFLKVITMCLRSRYDVIHAVEEAAFMAWFAGKLSKTPYVFDMDSSMPAQISDKYRLPQWVVRMMEAAEGFVIRRSSGVVAVCKSLETLARSHAPEVPVLRLEDVSLLTDCETTEDLRKSRGIVGGLVLYVGNLEGYQGIDLLLDSFAIACGRCAALDLVVIGGAEADIERCRRRAVEHGIENRTHLIGPRPVEELGSYLRQADVLVSPRIKGGNTPMKIYSYLDSGVAVLATDLDTHTQVMDPSIALLARPEPQLFAEGILTLAGDSELRKRLAEAARKRVADEFSVAAFSRKLSGFYQEMESRSHPVMTSVRRADKSVGEEIAQERK